MRIRKNAKLSPLLFSCSSLQGGSVPVESFQTHVCQLNQSPWDVIPFHSDSIQFQPDDSFTAPHNGSPGDSFGAVESVASMMDADDKVKTEDAMMMMVDDNHDNSKVVGNKGVARNSCCQGFDAKGWPCKNGTKQAQSFCDQHLSLLRSYNNNNNNKKAAAAAAAAAGARRVKTRAVKKTPTSNPYEFYYYSGFGPLWGKRRGDRNGEGSRNGVGGGENLAMVESDNAVTAAGVVDDVGDNNNNNNNNGQSDAVPSASEMDNEEFDYVDDDEEEDDSGKKRMRKPVKARSLKSLM